MKGFIKRAVAGLLSVCLCAGMLCASYAYKKPESEEFSFDTYKINNKLADINARIPSYRVYKELHKEAPNAAGDITLDIFTFKEDKGVKKSELDGRSCLITDEQSSVTFSAEILSDGLYRLEITYYPVEGKGNNIERAFLIDGEYPYTSLSSVYLSRVWQDLSPITLDAAGSSVRPKSAENPSWLTTVLRDVVDNPNEELFIFLSKGSHSITVNGVREPLAIGAVRLIPLKKVSSYEEVRSGYETSGFKSAKESVLIQAEEPFLKSDPMIYAISDFSSPATTPYSIGNKQLNTIGREKWQYPGQWISWEVDVPETGLYKISTRYRQNMLDGMYVSRRLTIDGESPFEEAGYLTFPYADEWQTGAFGDDYNGTYAFYLTKGKHELRLDVTTGYFARVLMDVSESVRVLNDIYRQIQMITGSQPDIYRNYQFDSLIPDTLEEMRVQEELLTSLSSEIVRLAGSKGSQVAVLDKLALDLRLMHTDSESIAAKMEGFIGNAGALAAWLTESVNQPLELDYIMLQPLDEPVPAAEKGFIAGLVHMWDQFTASFRNDDYIASEGEQAAEAIKVWISNTPDTVSGQNQASSTKAIMDRGRDLAELLQRMIGDTFIPEHNLDVNLQLVPWGTLMPAVLAGNGPDIAFQIAQAEPVKFASRGAAADLTQFPDFEEVASRFNPNALVPFSLEGGVYALPDTYSYMMMFYRRDILDEMNIKLPETWEDVYEIIPLLQKKNLNIGIPWDINMFASMIYQNGLFIYTADGSHCLLDEKPQMQVFDRFTRLNTNYRLPLAYDFVNRFRTGSMPIGLFDFTVYNQLMVFAPEIRGAWDFAPVPGVRMADGTINRMVTTNGVASIILEQSKHKQAAWEFLKWWSDAPTQVRFAKELESQLGTAARYPTANLEAMEMIPWNYSELQKIKAQGEWTRAIPEVPGGYVLQRYVDFSFKAVVNSGEDAGEQIRAYNQEINDEIRRKRIEFGLPLYNG